MTIKLYQEERPFNQFETRWANTYTDECIVNNKFKFSVVVEEIHNAWGHPTFRTDIISITPKPPKMVEDEIAKIYED